MIFSKWALFANRDGDYLGAAEAFGRCAERSLGQSEHIYVESARFAQANCLAAAGQPAHAKRLLGEADKGGAVWLGGRVDRQSV